MACTGTLKDPPYGLVGCHAYTVLGVMDEESSGLPKLIKLRNPWGEQDYTGPYSYVWLETRGMKKEAELLFWVQGVGSIKQVGGIDVFVKHEHCEESLKELFKYIKFDH